MNRREFRRNEISVDKRDFVESLVNHVGCGDLDIYGKCASCEFIRILIRDYYDRQ